MDLCHIYMFSELGDDQFLIITLGDLLFSLHINDITSDIESEIRLFADDCVC